MDATQIQTFVQIGETVAPLVITSVEKILAFAKDNGGDAATIAQLEANARTIAEDAKILDDGISGADTPPQP